MQSIAKYLARFAEEVKLLNSIGDFSINTHAENVLVTVLNEVYGLHLVNVNPTEGQQAAAIDLLDDTPGGAIAFQVTSTASIEKVKDCIRKYFRNRVYKRAGRLKVFVITAKQNSYSQEAIDKIIREESAKAGAADLSFSVEEDIMDRKNLYNYLYAGNDLDKIKEVEYYLRRQFGLADEKDRLKAYYERLKTMFYDTVMDDENGMTLDQVYIEPSFSVIHSALKKDHPCLNAEESGSKKFYMADPRYKTQEFIEDMFSGENPLYLHVMTSLILILGYPGQGKSSFCKKFMHSYILKGVVGKKPLFYFQLRNIRQAKEFIFNPLTVLYEEACTDTEQTLDKYQFNKAFLILDGLDELYLRDNLKMEDIDKLCVELIRLLEKHPDLRIVLTSRYGYIDDAKLAKEKINIIQLTLFSFPMQHEWLNRYRLFHPETWLTEDKLNDFHKAPRYTHILELIEQPLLLHMIASIKNEIGEHTNRSGVYQQLFSEVIDRRYAREGQLEVLKGVTKADLRELLREIAFAIFRTGNEYITRTDLLKLGAARSFLQLLPEENFRDSIKGVMISFYFKETRKLKEDHFDEDKSDFAIEFLHRSLREYMTAEKLFFTLKEKFLERKMNGKYVIDDAKAALQIINEMFGPQELSEEIIGHLKEIVHNTPDFSKEELTDRMLLFLPEYFENDFIVEYRMGSDRQPVNFSVRCFSGLWQFVSVMDLRKDYLLTDEVKKKFVYYLNIKEVTRFLALSHQDISGQEISTHLYECNLDHADLAMCRIVNTAFVYCTLAHVNFNRCLMYNTDMFGSDLTSCTFNKAEIDSLKIEDAIVINCDFTNSTIVDIRGKARMRECNFSGAEISSPALKHLKKVYPEITLQGTLKFEHVVMETITPPVIRERQADPKNYKRLI
jgi:hypothetical protein